MSIDESSLRTHLSRKPIQATLLIIGLLYFATLISNPYVELIVAYGYPLVAIYTFFRFRPDADAPTCSELIRENFFDNGIDSNVKIGVFLFIFMFVFVLRLISLSDFSLYIIAIGIYYYMDYPNSLDNMKEGLNSLDGIEEWLNEIEEEYESELSDHVQKNKPNTTTSTEEEAADTSNQMAEDSDDAPVPSPPVTEKVDVLEYGTPPNVTYEFVEVGRGEQVIDAHIKEVIRRRRLGNAGVGLVSLVGAYVIGPLLNTEALGSIGLSLTEIYLLVAGIGVGAYVLASLLRPARPKQISRSGIVEQFDRVPSLKARSIQRETAMQHYPREE